jgi:hypothetical protein
VKLSHSGLPVGATSCATSRASDSEESVSACQWSTRGKRRDQHGENGARLVEIDKVGAIEPQTGGKDPATSTLRPAPSATSRARRPASAAVRRRARQSVPRQYGKAPGHRNWW